MTSQNLSLLRQTSYGASREKSTPPIKSIWLLKRSRSIPKTALATVTHSPDDREKDKGLELCNAWVWDD
jgi:hypothetical protein